jgi:hypothetical protein
MNKFAIALLSTFLAAPVIADSTDMLLATKQSMKGGSQRVALDIVAKAPFAGFEFELDVSQAAKVGTANCVAELPKGLNAKCVVTKWGTVKAMVFMTEAGEMPAGRYKVGYLEMAGSTEMSVKSVMFADGAAVERAGTGVAAE